MFIQRMLVFDILDINIMLLEYKKEEQFQEMKRKNSNINLHFTVTCGEVNQNKHNFAQF